MSSGWWLRSGSPCRRVETCCSRSLPSATSCTYSFVRIAAFVHLTVCSGWCCDSYGLGGETHWCWSSRPRSTVGIARGSTDAGAAARDIRADHASILNVEVCFGAWPPKTVSGVLLESTASYSSSGSPSQNARCRGICHSDYGHRHRHGVPSSRITSASSRRPRHHCTRQAVMTSSTDPA
jgi:hypothetical protein